MTPQELKNSIIKLALEGKLVKGSDSSGIDLYNKIVNHKKELKIANKKHLDSNSDSFPFDIPENWKWCRFGEVVDYRMGKTPPRAESEWWTNDIPWISITDMIENGYVSNTKEKVSNSALRIKFGGNISPKGTLIMSFKLTVGRVSILDIDAVHNEAIISIIPYVDELNTFRNYLFYALPFLSQFGETKGAIKGNTLNDTSLCNLPIPLPSFEEQKRIVARIEELLLLVNRYEKAWTKLEAFNQKFPADMEKSILQYAIQGKLVEQITSEGNAEELFCLIQKEKNELIKKEIIKKQKLLPAINQDDVPFEIPQSWKWCRFTDLAYLTSGGQYIETKEGLPYLKVADMNLDCNKNEIVTSSRFTSPDNKGRIKKNSIIFPKRGGAIATNKKRIVKQTEVYIDSNTMALTVYKPQLFDFVKLWFDSIDLGKMQSGTSVPQINNKDLEPLLIPLPPLEEQKRIVAKLEELLPLCRKLIK